jgi:nitroimidazol reductase NimA-like FMN-containing flavoprotein (pyridoxamine 5'-phosphate oxidase superfamily)
VTQYPRTATNTAKRLRERISYDADLVHAILDEALICHVGFDADGPLVLPMVHARVGDNLYLHASTGSGVNLRAEGTAVCLTATIVDGLVLAKTQFNHSMNYRSVVVRGTAHAVTDPQERGEALWAIVEHVSPGRAAASRPANAKELAATAVLRVALESVSAKVRAGGPHDDGDDADLDHWCGVIPLRLTAGAPRPADYTGSEHAPAPDPRLRG